MRAILITFAILLHTCITLSAQTKPAPKREVNFMYHSSDEPIVVSGEPFLDSLINAPGNIKLLRYETGGYSGDARYVVLKKTANHWIYQKNKIGKVPSPDSTMVDEQMALISLQDSCNLNRHIIYNHGRSGSADKTDYKYILIMDKVVKQTLICNSRLSQIPDPEVKDIMKVFAIIDEIVP